MKLALVVVAVLAFPTVAAGSEEAAPRLPSLAAKCGSTFGVSAAPFWLRAEDGVRLYAVEAGAGRIGVVLAHESPADLCGWLPYMRTLAQSRVRTLAFDFRGFGSSQRPASLRDFLAFGRDFRAAVARLRRDGAARVFVAGASFGGAAALTYAPDLAVRTRPCRHRRDQPLR